MEALTHSRAVGRIRWVVLAKLAVTALLLGFLVAHASPIDIATRLAAVSPKAVAAATCLLTLAFLAVGFRWQIILKSFCATASLGDAIRLALVGGFFNQVLPSGMGGDAFRVWYARGFDMSTGQAVASVFVDRMCGFLAVTMIVLAGTPFALLWMDVPGPIMTAAALVMGLLLGGAGSFLIFDFIEPHLTRLLQHVTLYRFRAMTLRGVAGIAWSARRSRSVLYAWPSGAMIIGISLICQLLVGAAAFLLLRDLGQPVALITVVFLFTFVQLISMLPISFAGWGLREGGMVVAFRFAGVPAEDALGASILYGICLLASSLPGALLWFSVQRKHRVPLPHHEGQKPPPKETAK